MVRWEISLCFVKKNTRNLITWVFQKFTIRKDGVAIMMMDYITFAGFILAVFEVGVAVGRIVEKIERLDRRKENEQ